MRNQSERIVISLAVLAALIVGALAMMSLFSGKPSNLGVTDGRLADCPNSPNCVSTQAGRPECRMEPIPFTDSSEAAMRRIKTVVAEMPRAKIVILENNYLHVEFRSAFFRFVDDVEFLIDPEEQLIHFRSASRVGYSDFGVNRDRMERIRKALGE
ncbi:MAG: DUF1499 domain-containing protein [Planctomycetota bacterium]